MIVINGRFLTQKVTGVQRFGMEVVRELDHIVKPGEVILASPPGIINNLELKNIKIVTIGKKSNNFWVQCILPKFAKKNRAVILTISGLCPIIKPDYFLVHDVTLLRHPESFSLTFRMTYLLTYKLCLNRCKKIFTISNFSLSEIKNLIGVDKTEFVLASPSSSHLLRNKYEEQDLNKWSLNKNDYYLSVSSQNKHKNQEFVLELADLHPNKKFVIVGGSGIKSFNSINFEKRNNVLFTGYVDDNDLFTLYKHAKGFIFPSLYEGFGLPPLEAITMGVEHIAVSDIPVFKEIYNKSVYYFDPNNPKSFSFDDMNSIELNKEDYVYYLAKHDWKKTAEIIFNTIKYDAKKS